MSVLEIPKTKACSNQTFSFQSAQDQCFRGLLRASEHLMKSCEMFPAKSRLFDHLDAQIGAFASEGAGFKRSRVARYFASPEVSHPLDYNASKPRANRFQCKNVASKTLELFKQRIDGATECCDSGSDVTKSKTSTAGEKEGHCSRPSEPQLKKGKSYLSAIDKTEEKASHSTDRQDPMLKLLALASEHVLEKICKKVYEGIQKLIDDFEDQVESSSLAIGLQIAKKLVRMTHPSPQEDEESRRQAEELQRKFHADREAQIDMEVTEFADSASERFFEMDRAFVRTSKEFMERASNIASNLHEWQKRRKALTSRCSVKSDLNNASSHKTFTIEKKVTSVTTIQESYRFVTMLELASDRFLRKVERQFSNKFYSLVEELQNRWLQWSHATLETTLRDLKELLAEMRVQESNRDHKLNDFKSVIDERVNYARNRAAESACRLHRRLERSFQASSKLFQWQVVYVANGLVLKEKYNVTLSSMKNSTLDQSPGSNSESMFEFLMDENETDKDPLVMLFCLASYQFFEKMDASFKATIAKMSKEVKAKLEEMDKIAGQKFSEKLGKFATAHLDLRNAKAHARMEEGQKGVLDKMAAWVRIIVQDIEEKGRTLRLQVGRSFKEVSKDFQKQVSDVTNNMHFRSEANILPRGLGCPKGETSGNCSKFSGWNPSCCPGGLGECNGSTEAEDDNLLTVLELASGDLSEQLGNQFFSALQTLVQHLQEILEKSCIDFVQEVTKHVSALKAFRTDGSLKAKTDATEILHRAHKLMDTRRAYSLEMVTEVASETCFEMEKDFFLASDLFHQQIDFVSNRLFLRQAASDHISR